MAHVTDMPGMPMYLKIKNDIMQQVKNNLLLPGDRLPTELQLMEKYGVSRITVSKALGELKNEGYVERFPNKGTFVADASLASSLVNDVEVPERTEPTSDILPEVACILPTLKDLFSLTMLNGALSVFSPDRYLCHIFHSQNPQMENYLLRRCLDTDISGMILFPQDQPFFSNELLSMQLQKYPLVLLDRYLPRLDTSYVVADNKAAGKLCMDHLPGLGHRKVALVTATGRNTFSVKYRIAGLYSAAERWEMPESAIHIVEYFDQGKDIAHYQEMFRRLVVDKRVTAFIAAECGVCAYLYNLFASLGLKVPADVSLLSFDRPMTGMVNPDFFTYINQSEYLMGKEAGNILRRRLEHRDMNVYHKIITPTLEVHGSTGKVPQ